MSSAMKFGPFSHVNISSNKAFMSLCNFCLASNVLKSGRQSFLVWEVVELSLSH